QALEHDQVRRLVDRVPDRLEVRTGRRAQPRGPHLRPAGEGEQLVAEPVAVRAPVLNDVAGVDERPEQPVRRAALQPGALRDLYQADLVAAGDGLEHGETARERVDS